MRNMRSAFWALGLAGAAYAWRNRGRLREQLGQVNGSRAPFQLPDFNRNRGNSSEVQDRSWEQSRPTQFGGTEV